VLRRAFTYLAAATAVGALAAAPAGAATTPPVSLPTATNGKPVQLVAAGLGTPTSFAFGAGKVFEGDGGKEGPTGPPTPGGVFLLSNGLAQLIPGSPSYVAGLAWHRGTLYVSGGYLNMKTHALSTWKLLAWSGWNGTKFTKKKVIYTAPKGFPGFNGLAFGDDGLLYAGVDVGFTNDHAKPTKKTPYLYDILRFSPNGKHLTVFARGIRQPWQMAWDPGTESMFVTDLGQDSPPKLNPPDFLLRVRQGQNYGFPACNWVTRRKCKGFARPFKFLAPHTDPGGLGIIGKRLYMTEFGFAPGHPAQVVWMPLRGGRAKTFVTGFSAGDGVIGLGVIHRWVYFGDTDGFVYRVHT